MLAMRDESIYLTYCNTLTIVRASKYILLNNLILVFILLQMHVEKYEDKYHSHVK